MRTLVLMFVVLLTASCADTGGSARHRDATAYPELSPGISTKPDVFSLLGQPTDVLASGQNVEWIYVSYEAGITAASWIPIVGLAIADTEVDMDISKFRFDGNILLNPDRFKLKDTVSNYSILDEEGSSAVRSERDAIKDRVKSEMKRLELPFDEAAAESASGYIIYTRAMNFELR